MCIGYIVFLHKNNMWTEMSNPAILTKLGIRIKDTRIRKNITQEELAIEAGVSSLTIANIEKGKSVTLFMFISVLRALGILENLENLVPEMKVSPLLLKQTLGKKQCRVRRLKPRNNE